MWKQNQWHPSKGWHSDSHKCEWTPNEDPDDKSDIQGKLLVAAVKAGGSRQVIATLGCGLSRLDSKFMDGEKTHGGRGTYQGYYWNNGWA